MFKINTIWLVIGCLIVGCKNQETKVIESSLEKVELQNSEKTSPILKIIENDFRYFLKQFSTDSNYQLSHIKFPLYYDAGIINGKQFIDSIIKEDWLLVNLTDTLNLNAKDDLIFNSNVGLNTSSVLLKGAKSKAHYEYHFKRKDEEWQLVKYFDYSV